MKSFITKSYEDIKLRKDILKTSLLFEGLFLIFVSILVYLFDIKIGNFTVLYLFPLTLMLVGFKYMIVANKYKELKMNRWLLVLINSFIYLFITLYLVLDIMETKELFIIFLGGLFILKSITDFAIIEKHMHISELIRYVISIIIGILLIVFNNFIVVNYLYLVIFIFVIGLINLIEYFLIRKK